MQEVVCRRMALASATGEDGMSRQLYRAALATLPRGGGNGDDIRLGILQLMRENGIKEGHRPGIEDPFIAQWHQKLHSNTTVDDIYICEAYLHFLHTGNWVRVGRFPNPGTVVYSPWSSTSNKCAD